MRHHRLTYCTDYYNWNATTESFITYSHLQTNGSEKASLFWVINHTTTAFGRRLLKKWISQPMRDVRYILIYLNVSFYAASALRRRNLKMKVSLWKCIKCFPFTLHWRNWKTQWSPVILDLCLKKTWAGKYHVVVTSLFSKPLFSVHTKMQSPIAISNSSSLKSLFVFVTSKCLQRA